MDLRNKNVFVRLFRYLYRIFKTSYDMQKMQAQTSLLIGAGLISIYAIRLQNSIWKLYKQTLKAWPDLAPTRASQPLRYSPVAMALQMQQYWTATWENVPSDMSTQQRLKLTCTSAQSGQSLRCLHEETLHPWLSNMSPVKIQLSLRECVGWSESSLSAHIRRYVFWRYGAYPFAVFAGMSYWLVGYAFAFGEGNSFIGYSYFAHSGLPPTLYAKWFFQFTFAAAASTIVSGAVAERCDFSSYMIYSTVITGQYVKNA